MNVSAMAWPLAWAAATVAVIWMAAKAWRASRKTGWAPFPAMWRTRAPRWTVFVYPLGFLIAGGFIAVGLWPTRALGFSWLFFAAVCAPVLPSQWLQLRYLEEEGLAGRAKETRS